MAKDWLEPETRSYQTVATALEQALFGWLSVSQGINRLGSALLESVCPEENEGQNEISAAEIFCQEIIAFGQEIIASRTLDLLATDSCFPGKKYLHVGL